jgi:hypothetical protein
MSVSIFDGAEWQTTPGGIMIARDKGFVERYYDILTTAQDDALSPEFTQQGMHGMRGMIIREVPDDTGIPLLDRMVVPASSTPIVTTGAAETTPIASQEQRRKIALFEPLIFVYRRHRPFRTRLLRNSHPDDYAISVGLISDFEFALEDYAHVHGTNRSTLIWDARWDSAKDEDGLTIRANSRGRSFFGRLHDVIKVASTVAKNEEDSLDARGRSLLKIVKGFYRAALNWTPRGGTITLTGENDEPQRLSQIGGYVYNSGTKQISNVDTVFLFGGETDKDENNWDDEPITLLDIRHDAHFVRGDSNASAGDIANPGVVGHQDGHLGFTSIPKGKDVNTLQGSQLDGFEAMDFIGWLVPDAAFKNLDQLGDYRLRKFFGDPGTLVPMGPGTELNHETAVWRPQIQVMVPKNTSEGSQPKPNDTGTKPGSGHTTKQAPGVVYTSPRQLTFGPTGLTTLTWSIPNVAPRVSGSDEVEFRLHCSISAAISTNKIKTQLSYLLIDNDGTISPTQVDLTKDLDSTTIPAGSQAGNKKFIVSFDIGPVSTDQMIWVEFLRLGDHIDDTFSGMLSVMEASWVMKRA